MMGHLQVAQLVVDNVIDAALGHLHELEVEDQPASGAQAAPACAHGTNAELRVWHARMPHARKACLEPLGKDLLGAGPVPALEQSLHTSRVFGFRGHMNAVVIDADPLEGPILHLEPVVPAQIAVRLTAHVLSGREMGQVALVLELLAAYPLATLDDATVDLVEGGVLGRGGGHGQVGEHADGQSLAVGPAELVCDGVGAKADAARFCHANQTDAWRR